MPITNAEEEWLDEQMQSVVAITEDALAQPAAELPDNLAKADELREDVRIGQEWIAWLDTPEGATITDVEKGWLKGQMQSVIAISEDALAQPAAERPENLAKQGQLRKDVRIAEEWIAWLEAEAAA